MFTVRSKNNKTIIREVYDIRVQAVSNEIQFLMYTGDGWMWCPANKYEPYDDKAVYISTDSGDSKLYDIAVRYLTNMQQKAGYSVGNGDFKEDQ